MKPGDHSAFPAHATDGKDLLCLGLGLTKREWMATMIVAGQGHRMSLSEAMGLADELLIRLNVKVPA